MKKAIVLGSGFNSFAVIRELHEGGVRVINLSTAEDDFASYSRFIYQNIRVPSPENQGNKLLTYLMDASVELENSLLIPTDDSCAIFLSKNRDAICRRYKPAVEKWSILEKIIDKSLLYREAQSLDIRIPRIFVPETVEALYKYKDKIEYPCLLKPCQKTVFFQLYKRKLLEIHDWKQLLEKLTEAHKQGIKMMVSEIIPGPDTQIFNYRSYIDNQGNILAEICTQKLRQHPKCYGDGSVQKTIPMIPAIRNLSLRLLKALSYTGFSSVEYKHDPQNNQFKLIEMNIRSAMCQRLFTKAGINFSLISYFDLVENKKICSTYKNDIFFINNYFDTLELLGRIRNMNLNLIDFFRPYLKKRNVLAVPFDDPRPFFIMNLNILKSLNIFKVKKRR